MGEQMHLNSAKIEANLTYDILVGSIMNLSLNCKAPDGVSNIKVAWNAMLDSTTIYSKNANIVYTTDRKNNLCEMLVSLCMWSSHTRQKDCIIILRIGSIVQ